MADEILTGSPAPAAESAPSQVPASSESPAPAAAGESSAPADTAGQEVAFGKRLGQAVARKEAEIRAQLEYEYQAKLAELTPPPPVPTDEQEAAELAELNEQLLNEFYENPILAMKKANQIIGERQAQREQAIQAQWNYQAQILARKYEDWGAVQPKMRELLQQHPDMAERPEHLERVYRLAKGWSTSTPSAPPSADALLQDPAYLAQVKGLLRDQIIQEYVNEKRAPGTPPLMGNSAGGTAPAMPPSTPKSWDEAKRAAWARTNPS